MSSINKIRQRVGINTLNDDITQSALRDSIRLDRRRELMFEGFRWWDLVRWGEADKMAYKGFEEGKHEFLPVPQLEINYNPKLKQNPN